MSTLISLAAKDIKPYEELEEQLGKLGRRIKQEEEQIYYQISPGSLLDFILLLQRYRLSYCIQFDTKGSYQAEWRHNTSNFNDSVGENSAGENRAPGTAGGTEDNPESSGQ